MTRPRKPLRRTAWGLFLGGLALTAVTCDEPAQLLTGTAITVALLVRGSLVAVPAFAAGVGFFLFFPRFTALAARLSHPYGRLVDRVTGRDRS